MTAQLSASDNWQRGWFKSCGWQCYILKSNDKKAEIHLWGGTSEWRDSMSLFGLQWPHNEWRSLNLPTRRSSLLKRVPFHSGLEPTTLGLEAPPLSQGATRLLLTEFSFPNQMAEVWVRGSSRECTACLSWKHSFHFFNEVETNYHRAGGFSCFMANYCNEKSSCSQIFISALCAAHKDEFGFTKSQPKVFQKIWQPW